MPDFIGWTETGKNGKGSGEFFYTDKYNRVVEAFNRYARGESFGTIMKALGYNNIPALRKDLTNYWALGIKATTKARVNGKRVKREEPVLTETNLVQCAQVSRELFDTVQDKLAANHHRWTDRTTVEYLGRRLLKCPKCGSPMYPDTRKDYPYYRCSKRVTKKACDGKYLSLDAVEAEIAFAVRAFFCQKDVLASHIEKAWNVEESKLAARRAEEQRKMIAGLDRKLKNLVKEMSAEDDDNLRAQIKSECKTLSEQLTAARNELRNLESHVPQTGDAMAIAIGLAVKFMGFSSLSPQDQKALIDSHIISITIGEDGVARFEVRADVPKHIPVKRSEWTPDYPLRKMVFGDRVVTGPVNSVELPALSKIETRTSTDSPARRWS